MSHTSSPDLTIGPYEVLSALHRSLAVSRFACAYPSEHPTLRLVSVAVHPASTAERVFDSAQLLERIATVRNLQHALIPDLLDVALRGERLYTVDAFGEGVSLRELLDAMRGGGVFLDAETGASLLSDIAGALIHALERPGPSGAPSRLFHGALCSDLIVVTLRGEIRIEQFALAPWLTNRAGMTPLDGSLEDVRALAQLGAEALLGSPEAASMSWRHMAAQGLPDEIAQTLEAAMLQPAERSVEALSSMRASLQLWLRSRPTFSSRHRLRTLLYQHLPSRAGSSLPPDAQPAKRADFLFLDAASLAVERQSEPEPLSDALLAACGTSGFASREAEADARRPMPTEAPAPTPGAGSPVLAPAGRTPGASLAMSAFDAEMFSGETLAVPMPSDYLPESVRAGLQPPAPPVASFRSTRSVNGVTGSHLWQGSEASTGNAPAEQPAPDRLSIATPLQPAPRVVSRRWMLVGALSAAGLLYGLLSWQQTTRPPANADQQILLTSSPAGARVVIGGVETGAVTPTTLVGTSLSEIKTLTVRRDGFETPAVGSADVTNTAPLSLLFTLKPLPHTIRVDSNPPGATVTVNGTPCGTTPTVCMPVYVDPADGATIEFRRDGFSPAIVPHTWEPSLPQSSVNQTLVPAIRGK